MTEGIIKKQQKVYRENFLDEGACARGVFWNNTETQFLRFERLFAQLRILPDRFSVHDVGSGMADLHTFLRSEYGEHVYSGTEIVQEMIDHAQEKYPDIKLHNRDILTAPTDERYDIVVMSGTINMPAGVDITQWKEYALQLIKKMYMMAHIGISFNFLTTNNTFTDSDLCYFDPQQMFEYCIKNLSRFTVLDQAYPLYENTITVFKKEYMKNIFAEVEFEKYFKQ